LLSDLYTLTVIKGGERKTKNKRQRRKRNENLPVVPTGQRSKLSGNRWSAKIGSIEKTDI